jgi:hypothetical protein
MSSTARANSRLHEAAVLALRNITGAKPHHNDTIMYSVGRRSTTQDLPSLDFIE